MSAEHVPNPAGSWGRFWGLLHWGIWWGIALGLFPLESVLAGTVSITQLLSLSGSFVIPKIRVVPIILQLQRALSLAELHPQHTPKERQLISGLVHTLSDPRPGVEGTI